MHQLDIAIHRCAKNKVSQHQRRQQHQQQHT